MPNNKPTSATIKTTKPAPAKANQPPKPVTRAAIRRSLGLDSVESANKRN
jgi:hypothetical protein